MSETVGFERITKAEYITLVMGGVLGSFGAEFADVPSGISGHIEHILRDTAGAGLGGIALSALTYGIRYGLYRRNQGGSEESPIASSVQELEELYKLD